MKKVVRSLFIILAFVSCKTNKNMEPASYARFMEDEQNSFKKEVVAGATTYTFQLATPEFMTTKEFAGTNSLKDTTAFNERLKELNGYIFFLIKIRKKGQEERSPSVADERVSYYQFQAASDLSLLCNGESIIPATYFFEDNYSLTPYNTIVAGFKCKLAGDLQLTFNDRFEQNPFIKVTFTEQEISQLPHLKIL